MGHRARVPAVLAATGALIAAVAGLSGGLTASAQTTCAQWDVTGTWQTHQANNYDPVFSFAQSGTALSGKATLPGDQYARAGFSGEGTVSGSMSGTSLHVSVTWPKSDGGSATGNYSATVIAGATAGEGKLSEGSAGGLAWTGGGPATCVKAAEPKAALGATSKATPAPGGSVKASSPESLSAGASKVSSSITSSSGSLDGTTIVADAAAKRRTEIGEAVAACWLIGPDALSTTSNIYSGATLKKLAKAFESIEGPKRVVACMGLVSVLYKERRTDTSGAAAAASCRATRLEIVARRDRRGHITSLRARRRAPGKRDVRYSCTTTTAGSVKVTADGRRRGGLRSGLGRKLDFGAVRSPDAAPDSGRLRFRFGI